MELCTTQAISNLHGHHRLVTSPTHLGSKLSIFLKQPRIILTSRGLQFQSRCRDCAVSIPRASIPEDRSSGTNQYVSEERDGAVTLEDSPPTEKNAYSNTVTPEVLKEESEDGQTETLELLDKFKLDSGDTYSVLLYGSGVLVGLWLASAIVGSIDSIPVFPKLMEVVGLAYTFWFTSRYLIFKESRDELGTKIEELKKQILGSNDE